MPKNKFKRIHTNKKLYFLPINLHMNFIFRNEWLKFDCWNKKIQQTSVQVLNLSFSTKALLGLLSLTLQRKGPLYEKVACWSKVLARNKWRSTYKTFTEEFFLLDERKSLLRKPHRNTVLLRAIVYRKIRTQLRNFAMHETLL